LASGTVFWLTRETVVKPEDFLPANTSFYYQQQGEDLDWVQEHKFLENIFLQEQRALLADLLSLEASSLRSYLWFKTADLVESTNIILELSEPIQPLLRRLSQEHPQYYYKKLSRHSFLITDHQEMLDRVSADQVSSFPADYFKVGTNIYGQGNQTWPMLEPFSAWWQSLSGGQDFFASFYGSEQQPIIKVWRPGQLEGKKQNNIYGSKIILPQDFDLALAFSQPLSPDQDLFITNDLLAVLFPALPREAWSWRQEEFLSPGSWLVEKGASWLLAGFDDWRSSLADLASYLEYSEEPSILPDGTSYLELVAQGDSPLTPRQYLSRDYWQWADLFGGQDQEYYYLSNNEAWIKDILGQNSNTGGWLEACDIEKEAYISDLFIINTEKIPEGPLKVYLKGENLGFVGIFGYFKGNTEFWQFCGQK